ncbi:MAG: FecR domain-containing protein [Chitinophaga sp.]|uniref:FecR family protein n=1 Tax=Chitinophaga sp. TaxID=1869181 RepID=UPI001B176E8E|nr:FecR domain-containing protein [Chitinophaga sp.]MBO9728545.1 FecR domain-containing protein [Chitinophaga sp.]
MKKEAISHKYIHYKESDFLTDTAFLEWVYEPTAANEAFWQEVISTLPQQKATIHNARLYLTSVTFADHTPSDEAAAASWEKHLLRIQNLSTSITPATKVHFLSRRRLLRVAAAIAGVVLLTGAWYLLKNDHRPQMISTRFGEMRTLTLPDGSRVNLNANSKITYRPHWEKGTDREVWLEGEALFTVNHLNKDTNQVKAGEKFLVHTKDLTVTVLGTVFDVRQRRHTTEVVLESGKIRLSFTNGNNQDILMNPGQLVSYSDVDKKPVTAVTAPEKYTAWKNQRLILQDPKVHDIVLYLEDNFGKKIIMEDATLNNRTVNGPILITSLDDALFVLSTVLNTTIVKQDSSTIILRSRVAQ